MLIQRLSAGLALILLWANLSAQDDLEDIFSDSDSPAINQIIKFNVGDLLFSDLSIQYEHFLSDFLSVEAGVGKTLGYKGWQFGNNYEEELVIDEIGPGGGYSYSLAIKSYFFEEGPDGIFLAPYFGYRKREYLAQTIEHKYYVVNFGAQRELAERVFLEYFSGIGVRNSSTSSLSALNSLGQYGPRVVMFTIYFSARIGYAF